MGIDMKFKKLNRKNARAVLLTIADRIGKDSDDAAVYIEELNAMLDDLLSQDFFGTEGQGDPRGDHRN